MTRSSAIAVTFVSLRKGSDQAERSGTIQKKNERLALFVSVFALGMETASVFHSKRPANFPNADQDIRQIRDGAFRDGMYLGRLAAERGVAPHILTGRWATEADRAAFRAGYERGYKNFLASPALLKAETEQNRK